MKLTTSLTIWNWHLAGTTLFGISEYLFDFGWIFGKSFKMESIQGWQQVSSIIRSQLVALQCLQKDLHMTSRYPGQNWCKKQRHFPKPPRKRALGHLRIFWEDSLSKNSVHSVVGPSFLRWQVLPPLFHGCSSIYLSSSALVGRSTGFDHRWAPSNYNLHTPNETSCRYNVKSIQQSLFDSHFTWIFAQNTQL